MAGGPCCLEGHPLAEIASDAGSALICDRCGMAVADAGPLFLSCATCDYDLCMTCGVQSAATEEERAARSARELRKLEVHEDFFEPAEADGAAPVVHPSSARDEVVGGAKQFSAVAYGQFALPASSTLRWPSGLRGAPSDPVVDEGEHVLGYPLTRLVVLVRTIHEWIQIQRSGRINWETIAHRMSTPRPGEPVPPPMSAADAHRLWRLLAYRMAAPQGLNGAEHTSAASADEAQLLAITGLERSRPAPPSCLDDIGLDADSDIDDFVKTVHARDHATPQMTARGRAARAPQWPVKGTPRLVGREFPPPPGVLMPRIATDGSGPLDLGLEPPRKVRALKSWPHGQPEDAPSHLACTPRLHTSPSHLAVISRLARRLARRLAPLASHAASHSSLPPPRLHTTRACTHPGAQGEQVGQGGGLHAQGGASADGECEALGRRR